MATALLFLALLVAPSLGERMPHIIGGNDVDTPGKYPWQGSLTLLGSHSCGCSLITKNWILTAGHCIISPLLQKVRMGVHSIKNGTVGKPITYSIKQAYVHPNFSMDGSKGFPNDVALIKLAKDVEMNEFVDTINLAPPSATNENLSDCVITGWGAVKMIGGIIPTMPDILQEAAVGIYNATFCEEQLETAGIDAVINDGHICVGELNQRGACSGDSGGPLACKHNGEYVVAGATSWGMSNCKPIYPSVYTRVSYFRTWIDHIMNNGY